jgi:SLT domain-containing protein
MAEKINAGREYFNSLNGKTSSISAQVDMSILQPEQQQLVTQISKLSGKLLDQRDIETFSKATPQQLQEYIQKKVNQQALIKESGYNFGTP